MRTEMLDDMTEEIAAGLDYGARQATEHLSNLQNVDPASLADYILADPDAASQLSDALAQLAALGQEAAELLEMLP